MFTFQEAALGYAKAAERVLGEDATYMNNNQELVPIFVHLLLQSLEISLKHLGIESGLFTEQEARARKLTRNGHGIRELAGLVNARLGADGNDDYPVVKALTAGRTAAFGQKRTYPPCMIYSILSTVVAS